MPNRGWRDIVADVLEIAKTPTNKTSIMYKAVLSYGLLLEYLKMTQDAGLLEYDSSTGKYRTTDGGFLYLKLFDSINSLVYRKGVRLPHDISLKRNYAN